MTTFWIIGYAIFAIMALTLILIGLRLAHSSHLRVLTVPSVLLWALAIFMLWPLLGGDEQIYRNGEAPWLAYLIGLPAALFSILSALIIIPAWLSRWATTYFFSSNNQIIEQSTREAS